MLPISSMHNASSATVASRSSFGTIASDVPRDSLDFSSAVFEALGEDRQQKEPQHADGASLRCGGGVMTTRGSSHATPSAMSAATMQQKSSSRTNDTYTGMGLFERPSGLQQQDQRRHVLGGAAAGSSSSLFGGDRASLLNDPASTTAESLRGTAPSTGFDAYGTASARCATTPLLDSNRLTASSALRYNAFKSTVAQDLRSPLQRDPHGQHATSVLRELDPRWVTIFGFPPEKASYILRQFSHYGEILQYHITGNWMDVEFRSETAAQKALAKNGKIFDNALMIGVVECLNPRSAFAPLEFEQKKKTISSWKYSDANENTESRTRLGASAAAKKRRFESIYREDEEAPKTKRPKKRPRQEESWFQSLVDYILRF